MGIILYMYFLFVGFLYADMMFKEKDIYFRVWMGGVFGTVILMSGIMIPSVFLGFTVISHIVLVCLAAMPYAVIKYLHKNEKIIDIRLEGKEKYMDRTILCALVLPVSLIIWVLMTNHILTPYDNGALASGQCTYGDLQMHLSFVTSIAEQKEFPPEYSLLSGTTLNYPFFVDMLSSSLYLFGIPLRWAVLIPSYVISFLLVMGFYIVAFSLTKRKSAAVLATVLFFINGGFGFAYFLDGAKADHSVFTNIFTGYYQTPTNLNEHNIRWSNTICDMIIPQRTTMAGWFMILPALWLLTDAVKTKSRIGYITLGVLAGFMPMVHTHSFMALGMICAVMFFMYLAGEKNKKEYITNWVIFGAIVAIMAAPQLLYWTFRQTSSGEAFLKPQFNWVNHNDPYFWFYLKNWGVTALLAAPAIWAASEDNKKLLAGCAFIFIVAELILFQPNEYDNNKLFYVVYMVVVIVTADWLVRVYDKLKDIPGRAYVAVITVIAATVSGALTIGREYVSGGEYLTFSADAVAMADYIKDNTDPNAVFLTGTEHTNPVCTLAGRTIYLGSSLYVYFHGMGNVMNERESEVRAAYSGSYEDMKNMCGKNNIEYVYVSGQEREEFNISDEMLSQLELVHSVGDQQLYKIK